MIGVELTNRTNRTIAGVVVVALSVGACTRANPFTREKQISKTAIGATVGAVLGGLGGLAAGDKKDRRRNFLIGAGLGALAGGGIGYYMDQQEEKLRQRLEKSGVSVTRRGNQIVLNMPNNITFDVDRAEVKAEFYEVLNAVALVFNEFEKTLIDVEGHTDSDGSDSHNLELSQRRATNVAQYFISQQVNQHRIAARGLGESRPVASNATSFGKSKNRRVEIHISPLTASPTAELPGL